MKKIEYPNGSVYVGEIKQGSTHTREGKGLITFSNGEKYKGGWKDDKKEGKGRVEEIEFL